jgi:hypothetical protein
MTWSVGMLAQPANASDYMSNFQRIPAVENRPPQVGHWDHTPTIIVCEYAPISETQIRSAVSFWERMGYSFHSTQYKNDPLEKCTNKNPKGYIIIHLVSNGIRIGETSLAQTHFYVDNHTKVIDWAKIYMRADIRETVLEHEIGHALGFLHYNRINHLMNEKWMMGGWDKNGLENKHR